MRASVQTVIRATRESGTSRSWHPGAWLLDPRNSQVRRGALLSLAFLAGYMVAPVDSARFLLLAALAALGTLSPLRASQALWLLSLTVLINPGLLVAAPGLSIVAGRWLVVAGGLLGAIRGRSIDRTRSSHSAVFAIHLGFVGVALSGLLFTSPDIVLSITKLLSWTVTTLAVLRASDGLDGIDRKRFIGWLAWLLALVVVGSALVAFSGVGYLRNGRDLQGVLNQPQVLGVFLAPVMTGSVVAFLKNRSPRWLALSLVTGIMLYSSSARGPALAVVLSLLAVLAISSVALRGSPFLRRTIRIIATGGAVASIAFVVAFPVVLGPIQDFVYSGREPREVDFETNINRLELVEASVENFRQSPLVGIGFGVASDPTTQDVTRIGGIPVGASTEKGVIVSAVLEETGVLGAALFAALLWKLVILAWQRNGPLGLGIVLAALGTNLGESTLLSAGGAGLYVWLVVALGAFIRFDPRIPSGRVLPQNAKRHGTLQRDQMLPATD